MIGMTNIIKPVACVHGFGLGAKCAAKRGAVAVLAMVLSLMSSGCATEPAEKVKLPYTTGDFNPPLVISSRPGRDGLAIAAANDLLSDADWRILEKLGPRPVWDRIEGIRKRVEVEHGDGEANASRKASTAYAPVDESTMPVTVMPAGEGTVRLFWVLRNHGGSAVASNRDAQTNRRSVSLTAPDLKPLVAIIQQQLGDKGTCAALPAENTLVITCPETDKSSVLQTLNQLDATPRQVEITAKIFEVSQDFDFQQGTELVLSHLAGDGSQSLASTFSAKRFLDSVTAGDSLPTQGSVLKLVQAFDNAGVSIDISFQLLAESGLIQVVSAPRMTVAVGQTGYMLAGQELPIQSANILKGVLQTSTQYKPVGVQLYITPQAASESHIKLHAISIVSAISGFTPLPTMDGGGFTEGLINPVIDSREAETSVTVGAGDTLVISGLRMVRSTVRENKIPWLGDLPGLEWMFKNHRTQQQITDLYFFVTPHLLPASPLTASAE